MFQGFNRPNNFMNNSNNPMNMMQQFMQFKNNFQGDPQQAVMNLLNSGRMSQSQLNQLQGMARQFMNTFKG